MQLHDVKGVRACRCNLRSHAWYPRKKEWPRISDAFADVSRCLNGKHEHACSSNNASVEEITSFPRSPGMPHVIQMHWVICSAAQMPLAYRGCPAAPNRLIDADSAQACPALCQSPVMRCSAVKHADKWPCSDNYATSFQRPCACARMFIFRGHSE
jgi:hypothetical protein